MEKCNHQHRQWSTTFEEPLVCWRSCFELQRFGLQFGHHLATFWGRSTEWQVLWIRQDRLLFKGWGQNCLPKDLHPAQGQPQPHVERQGEMHKHTHTQAPHYIHECCVMLCMPRQHVPTHLPWRCPALSIPHNLVPNSEPMKATAGAQLGVAHHPLGWHGDSRHHCMCMHVFCDFGQALVKRPNCAKLGKATLVSACCHLHQFLHMVVIQHPRSPQVLKLCPQQLIAHWYDLTIRCSPQVDSHPMWHCYPHSCH